MELTPENRQKLDAILARYPVKRSALLPALQLVQEQEGYIRPEAIDYLAGLLDLTAAQVHDTASFYTMYRFSPEGRHHIDVCTNISCALSGADEVIAKLCHRLGIQEGETTADGEWTVHRVECLAGCGGAVAMQVDGRWIEYAKPEDIEKILAGELRERPFEWPKSAGEMILLRNVFKEGSASLDVYRQGGGYARLKDFLQMRQADIVEAVKKSNLRGRGGAGFSAGMKWSFLAKNDKPRLPVRERGRGRAGNLQGPPHPRERPPPAHRGHHRLVVRHQLPDGVHLHARGVPQGPGRDGPGARRGLRGGLPREGHPRPRHRPRRLPPQRRRLLRVRRGDGAHREPGGQARPAAGEAALPGRGRALRRAHRGEQRGDDLLRAPRARQGRGVVLGLTGSRRTAGRSSTASAGR